MAKNMWMILQNAIPSTSSDISNEFKYVFTTQYNQTDVDNMREEMYNFLVAQPKKS